VRKVLSWLRSKPQRDGKSDTLADAWRLDTAGASRSLERPAAKRASEPDRPSAKRSVEERRPAHEPRAAPRAEALVRDARPTPQMPAPRAATEPRPARESRVIQELRTIQALRRVQELSLAPEPPRPQQREPTAAARPAPHEGTLLAAGLVKSFGGRRVVNDVSIGLRRGEAVGLLGPNGAGKTTAFYMIVGLIKADAGQIILDGHDVTGLPMYRRARLGIGYLPQEPSIFRGLTVENNIRSVLEAVEPDRAQREEQLDRLLEEFDIARVRRSPAIALSGGERRRVEIARALATRPSFMLLDEPFAGIDPIAVGDIQELVRHLTRRGIGVLITDHNVRETLGLVDRAYIVHSGSILMEGEPGEIVESEKVRKVYLGEEFRL
jgi:lipopolysaccharide export system ATP-binding protein